MALAPTAETRLGPLSDPLGPNGVWPPEHLRTQMEHRKSVQILPPTGPRNFLRHFWWIKHPAWSWWRSHCGKSMYHQGNASNTKQKAGPYRFSTGAKNEEIQYIPPSCGVWKVFFNDQATIIQPSSGYWYHAENYAINIPSMLIHSGAVLVILSRIKSRNSVLGMFIKWCK